MKRLLEFSKNKKTYAVVAVGLALGVADALGYHVPSYVEWGLAFLGLGTVRSSIKNHSAETSRAMLELVQEVLNNVTTEEPEPKINPDQLQLPIENKVEVTPKDESEITKQLNLRSIGKA